MLEEYWKKRLRNSCIKFRHGLNFTALNTETARMSTDKTYKLKEISNRVSLCWLDIA